MRSLVVLLILASPALANEPKPQKKAATAGKKANVAKERKNPEPKRPNSAQEASEDVPKIPEECLRDLDPSGTYDLILTSVPALDMPIKQCSPIGERTRATLRVEADVDRNYIKIISKNPRSVIREARLQRGITDFCKAKGATEPRVTWFSWSEYWPGKDGMSWTLKGFGAGDLGNQNVLRRLSFHVILSDKNNTPLCYAHWDSDDS